MMVNIRPNRFGLTYIYQNLCITLSLSELSIPSSPGVNLENLASERKFSTVASNASASRLSLERALGCNSIGFLVV